MFSVCKTTRDKFIQGPMTQQREGGAEGQAEKQIDGCCQSYYRMGH